MSSKYDLLEISQEFGDIAVDDHLFRSITIMKHLSEIDFREHVTLDLFRAFGLYDQYEYNRLQRNKENFLKQVILASKRELCIRELLDILYKIIFTRDVCIRICQDEKQIIQELLDISRAKATVENETKRAKYCVLYKNFDKNNNEMLMAKEPPQQTVLVVYKSTCEDSEVKKENTNWFLSRLKEYEIKFKDYKDLSGEDKLEFDYVFILYDKMLGNDFDEDVQAENQDSVKYKQLGNQLYDEYFTRRERGDAHTRFHTFIVDECHETDYYFLNWKNLKKIEKNKEKEILDLLENLSKGARL